MFKTILAFIKAHTIATVITTTAVVSTAVATPIIINQVQKPDQEVSQAQENIVDNEVSNFSIEDNTIVDNTEILEENNIEENTIVPEEEQKVEIPKEEKTNTKTETPKKDTIVNSNSDNKPSTPTQPSTAVQDKNVYFKYGGDGLTYNETQKIVTSNSNVVFTRDKWLNSEYSRLKNIMLEEADRLANIDGIMGYPNKDYCQKKITEVANNIYKHQEALEYYKLHKDEIQLTSENTYLYKGSYYDGNIEVAENYIKINLTQEKARWEAELKNAPQYSPNEKPIRDCISELERAYNYISTH